MVLHCILRMNAAAQFGTLLCVGILWGCTNPFIKNGSKGIEKINNKSTIKRGALEFKFLIFNISYLLPLIFNQLGSVLFLLALHNSNLSFTVPITNSLAFLFTAVTGNLMGEEIPAKNVLIGSCFILVGSTLLVYDKL